MELVFGIDDVSCKTRSAQSAAQFANQKMVIAGKQATPMRCNVSLISHSDWLARIPSFGNSLMSCKFGGDCFGTVESQKTKLSLDLARGDRGGLGK